MCETLIKPGAEVTFIENITRGQMCIIKPLMDNEGFYLIEHDIRSGLPIIIHRLIMFFIWQAVPQCLNLNILPARFSR
jgi:hypothetical protein